MTQNQELQQMLLEQARALRSQGMENPIKLEKEVMKAHALKGIADSLINSAKAEAMYLKQIGRKESSFYDEILGPIAIEPAQIPITEHTEGPRITEVKRAADKADSVLMQQHFIPTGNSLEGKKAVRIDAKTTIYVDVAKDTLEAVKEWHEKHPKIY